MVEEGKKKKEQTRQPFLKSKKSQKKTWKETRERETTSHSIVDRVYPNLQLKGRKGEKKLIKFDRTR